ncbi:MAG TPA: folylpolyglutamate synthase/dihydrofolate synthase family protein [Thermoplasmata archaeon]|nr:folylpolyglutamate synthase/dihydrofolate synthase family protein [Thermoplasmata archaeon]
MTREEYRATLEGLYRRRRFGIRPGLEVISALLASLGHPERAFPSIHVTGSKGKGSTAAMAQAILSAHGLPTALFTSPHLESYRERMRIDGRPIDPDAVVAGARRVEEHTEQLLADGTIDRAPTFFEVTTALAFDWFAREKVRAAVIEVGMGGRLDATNVLDSKVGAITTIELEHTELLGTTLGAIAHEKAGILHPGMTGVIGDLPPEARAVVDSEAKQRGVRLWHLGQELFVDAREIFEDGQTFEVQLPGRTVGGLSIPLHGRFQPDNAAVAVASVLRFTEATGTAVEDDAVRAGLANVRWPGRLERVGKRPPVFYDVAHTPDSARLVAQSLGEMFPLVDPGENAIVFGSLRGKNVVRILDALSPLAKTIVVVPIRSERSIPVVELKAQALGRFPRIVVARNPAEGVRLAKAATGTDGFALVVGSDYLIGELLRDAHGGNDEPDLSDPGTEAPREGPARPPPARRGTV